MALSGRWKKGGRSAFMLIMAGALLSAASAVATASDADLLQRVAAREQARVELIQRLVPTVISVFRVDSDLDNLAPGSGSGVIISPDGYALSNFHVTETTRNLRIGRVGGKTYAAKLLGLDRTGDIALLKIETDEELPYVPLGSSDELEVGQWVIAMGNPFLLATDFSPTVSMGVVSGLHRYLPGGGALRKDLIYADAIQIDAALNPGNSGGPLFNMQGELIGINGRIAPRRLEGMRVQKLNAGIGFAIPIDAIKRFLEDLKAGHEVDRGFLGVQQVSEDAAGLKIESLVAESPADVFGIRKGDILVSIDGQAFRDIGDVNNFVQTRPAGMRVQVTTLRDGTQQQRQVQLGGVQAVALLKMAELARARGTRLAPPVPGPEEEDEGEGDEDGEDEGQGGEDQEKNEDDGENKDGGPENGDGDDNGEGENGPESPEAAPNGSENGTED